MEAQAPRETGSRPSRAQVLLARVCRSEGHEHLAQGGHGGHEQCVLRLALAHKLVNLPVAFLTSSVTVKLFIALSACLQLHTLAAACYTCRCVGTHWCWCRKLHVRREGIELSAHRDNRLFSTRYLLITDIWGRPKLSKTRKRLCLLAREGVEPLLSSQSLRINML